MSKKSKKMSPDSETHSSLPTPRVLGALVALAAVGALWAVFLWGELLVARAGGTTFCAVSKSVDCSHLWDGGFASKVHAYTKVPIAGWGLVWSLGAALMPLWALIRIQEQKNVRAQMGAIGVFAVSGAVTVAMLAMLSIVEHTLCLGCLGTYVLVAGYAGVAFRGMRKVEVTLQSGLLPSAVVVVSAFFLLLYPGYKTPAASQETGLGDIRALAQSADPTATASPSPQPATSSVGTGDSALDQQLVRYVKSLPAEVQQGLSDSLYKYRQSPVTQLPAPRAVHGPAGAPIRIDEWTDARCGHCAQLHMALDEIAAAVKPGSFFVVPRQFPLDAACNGSVERRSDEPTSCVAALAQICLEGRPELHNFSGELFKNQQDLTSTKVYELAKPYMQPADLKKCVESAETKAKLDADVEIASRIGIEGTPLVVVNGRKGTAYPPFLFAIIATGGNADHPAFATLPTPDPHAHMH